MRCFGLAKLVCDTLVGVLVEEDLARLILKQVRGRAAEASLALLFQLLLLDLLGQVDIFFGDGFFLLLEQF